MSARHFSGKNVPPSPFCKNVVVSKRVKNTVAGLAFFDQQKGSVTSNNNNGATYTANNEKGQVFKTIGLQFDNWLFGPEKFSGLSRNKPQGFIKHLVFENVSYFYATERFSPC